MKDTDDLWMRDEIESPCIKICIVHPAERVCTGCLRSLDEIGSWARMTPEERRAIIAALPERAASLKQRRGGRAARLARAGKQPL
jgi:hypothetical protein